MWSQMKKNSDLFQVKKKIKFSFYAVEIKKEQFCVANEMREQKIV